MFSSKSGSWSWWGLWALIVSIAATALLSILDGILRGPVAYSVRGIPTVQMVEVWVSDFRFLFEQGVYGAIIFFIGAKFIETRTVLTVAFDKLDAETMQCRGPDENNVVWIGRRYGTKVEAQVVAEALAERLKQSATA